MLDFLARHKKVFVVSFVLLCVAAMILTARFDYRPVMVEDWLGNKK